MARKSAAVLAAEAAEEEQAAQAAALKECLDYMHVDEDDDNVGRIQDEFIPAAKAYLRGSGIEEPPDGSDPLTVAQYKLAMHSLTLHYYDHRDSTGTEAPIPLGLRPIINQLKHSGDWPL
jgi:hypothetical protein